MHESDADLERLQALLDASVERAGDFLRRSFEMPEHSLSARQLAAHLQGALEVALATVTAKGEPRVAPIEALFVHGEFHVPTVAESARARHLRARPAASLTYFEGIDVAVIVHGRAAVVEPDAAAFAELDELRVAAGHQSLRTWSGTGIFLRVEPETIYTYARLPERIG